MPRDQSTAEIALPADKASLGVRRRRAPPAVRQFHENTGAVSDRDKRACDLVRRRGVRRQHAKGERPADHQPGYVKDKPLPQRLAWKKGDSHTQRGIIARNPPLRQVRYPTVRTRQVQCAARHSSSRCKLVSHSQPKRVPTGGEKPPTTKTPKPEKRDGHRQTHHRVDQWSDEADQMKWCATNGSVTAQTRAEIRNSLPPRTRRLAIALAASVSAQSADPADHRTMRDRGAIGSSRSAPPPQ